MRAGTSRISKAQSHGPFSTNRIGLLAHDTSLAATQKVEAGLVDIARLADPARFATELRHWREAIPPGRAKPHAAEGAVVTILAGLVLVPLGISPAQRFGPFSFAASAIAGGIFGAAVTAGLVVAGAAPAAQERA